MYTHIYIYTYTYTYTYTYINEYFSLKIPYAPAGK